jgi:flavin-binding protein dodecin
VTAWADPALTLAWGCAVAEDRSIVDRGGAMSNSVYRVTEIIGTSTESWEAATRNAVETAAQSVRDLRIAEATRFDVTIADGKIAEYRVRLDLSFKYETGD